LVAGDCLKGGAKVREKTGDLYPGLKEGRSIEKKSLVASNRPERKEILEEGMRERAGEK